MQIQLELGPEFKATVAEISSMGAAIVSACSKGLDKAAKFAASHVVKDYLTNQSLNVRTGNLRRAVYGWLANDQEAIVGVHPDSATRPYAYLLGDEQVTIFPKKGSALTIPIGEALTGAGVPKWPSVAIAEASLGEKIFRLKGKNVLGYKRGKKGKFRPLFILAKSVLVQGTGALIDGVLESTDKMTEIIQNEVDKVAGN